MVEGGGWRVGGSAHGSLDHGSPAFMSMSSSATVSDVRRSGETALVVGGSNTHCRWRRVRATPVAQFGCGRCGRRLHARQQFVECCTEWQRCECGRVRAAATGVRARDDEDACACADRRAGACA